MSIERVTTKNDAIARRVYVDERVHKLACKITAEDNRPHGERARLCDVYIALVQMALKSKAKYKRVTGTQGRGLVLWFPKPLYNKLTAIAEAETEKGNNGFVSTIGAFYSLVEAGAKQYYNETAGTISGS